MEFIEDGQKVVHANDRLSELGISVICLAEVRKRLRGKPHFKISDILSGMQTVQLRVLENAKFQHPGDTDRGEFLYMAPYLEFGKKFWVHKDQLQHQIPKIIRNMLQQAMPSMDFTVPKIILMANACKNDDEQLANAGVDLDAALNITEKFDSQQLARTYLNTNQPGLGRLCNALSIRLVAKHNGGNDTAYTLAMVSTIALKYGSEHSLIPTTGDPVAEVGAVIESFRNPHYDFTETTLIATVQQNCEFCGLEGHAAIMCRRRCGCCLRKFSRHTYNNCPERSPIPQTSHQPARRGNGIVAAPLRYFLLPKMLDGKTRGFLHENDLTMGVKHVALSDVAKVSFGKKLSQRERRKLQQEAKSRL